MEALEGKGKWLQIGELHHQHQDQFAELVIKTFVSPCAFVSGVSKWKIAQTMKGGKKFKYMSLLYMQGLS